jgi:hypothetical protein
MKRNLLTIAAVLAVLTLINFKASAQQTPQSTTPLPLRIILSDVISITLLNSDAVVFTYDEASDYATFQNVPVTEQFEVVSTKAYSVYVKAESEFTVNASNAVPIPLTVVKVKVTSPTTGATIPTNPTSLGVVATDQLIASAAIPTISTKYSLNYSIPDATPLLNKVPGTYSTTLIYTVTQP